MNSIRHSTRQRIILLFLPALAVMLSRFACCADGDITQIFQETKRPSRSENAVNPFDDLDSLYTQLPKGLNWALIPSQEVGANEAQVIEESKDLYPHKMVLIDTKWSLKERFEYYRGLFNRQDHEKLNKLGQAAQTILNWNGFYFAEQEGKLGLEFLTELTDSGADLVDVVTAYYFANFLSGKDGANISDWTRFTGTQEYQRMRPFRELLELLVRPIKCASENSSEGMSISDALQDLRRKTTISVALPKEVVNSKIEKKYGEKLENYKQTLQEVQEIVRRADGVKSMYEQLVKYRKNPGDESITISGDDLNGANNIRREIGGSTTGFLFILQQLMKNGTLSESFYRNHKDTINNMVHLANDMDRYNFEIGMNQGAGKYCGNVVPSAYAYLLKCP